MGDPHSYCDANDLAAVVCVSWNSGWSVSNGKHYKYISDERNWYEAESRCVVEQAHLVSIHSDMEHQFVVGLNPNPNSRAWLGGRRKAVGNLDNFFWIDG